MAGLTAKQESACLKYLECGDKSEAYRFAYNTSKMKDKTIHEAACRLFADSKVAARMEELRAGIQERTEITVDAVAKELALLGFANTMDYIRISEEGEPFIDLSDLTREQAAAISETMVEDYMEGRGPGAREIRRVKIKFHDKKGALTKLGEYLGMFTQKIEVTGKDGGPIEHSIIAALRDRLADIRREERTPESSGE